MQRDLLFRLALLSIIIFFVFACKHNPDEYVNPQPPVIDPPIDTILCDSSNVTYPGVVYPILEAYCISCHSGPTPSGALDFTDYGDVAYIAQSGSFLGSIKHLPSYSPMPQGGDKISNCEIALIEKWINDTTFIIPPDTTDCDTSFVTYPGTVYPIFEANCISCHSGPTPEGGIDLTDFEDVAFLAQSGALMGSIQQLAGYSPMPQNAPPLTNCEITQIQKWINDTTFFEPGIPCDPDTVYFQNTVLPLLQSSCGTTGCHDPATAEHDIILTSYAYVMQTTEINPGDPWDSEIWEVIADDFQSDRMPPAPAAPLNQDQKDIIYDWILQGALNNYCDQEDCDSLNVTFSEIVFPIVQNSCYGCHSGSNPNGGISLTNYAQIKAAASIPSGSPGSLLGSITYSSGNVPMPDNGAPLSDCKIAQIRKWINDGMPDN
jgi:mono/diheme cytochrome c family protein